MKTLKPGTLHLNYPSQGSTQPVNLVVNPSYLYIKLKVIPLKKNRLG